MDQRSVGSLSDFYDEMALMRPKVYFLRGFKVFQCCFGCEGQQSDRSFEKDDPCLGPPHRPPQLYEWIDRNRVNSRIWRSGFSRWKRGRFSRFRRLLGADWSEEGKKDRHDAESLCCSMLQPVRGANVYHADLWIVANRRRIRLCTCGTHHQFERIS